MAVDPPIFVFDASILYPFHLRNIVVQFAVDRLVDARWTDEIHDEWIRNLAADMPGIPIERLQITRKLMNDALPDATVTGYRAHLEDIALPDPNDRHVVAAAIAAGASGILTWNLRDFPTMELRRHGLVRRNPDDLFTDLYDGAPDLTVASLASARRNLTKTRFSASDFIDVMKNQKLARLATKAAKHKSDL
jgi:PIN domain